MPVEPREQAASHSPAAETTSPKHDVLNREATDQEANTGQEVRDAVESDRELAEITFTRALWVCVACVIITPLAEVLTSLVGPWPSSFEAWPLWIALSVVLAVRSHWKGTEALDVARTGLLPIAVPCLLKFSEVARSGGGRRGVALFVALGALALLTDRVTSHFYYWLSAHGGLGLSGRVRLRDQWRWRFATHYPVSLLVLSLPFLLVEFGAVKRDALIWLVPSLAACWSLRAIHRVSLKATVQTTLNAFTSFVAWGSCEEPFGTPTPGTFRSPAGSPITRFGLFLTASVVLSLSFSMPLESLFQVIVSGETWRALLALLDYSLLPTVLILSSIMALGGTVLALLESDLSWHLGKEDAVVCLKQRIRDLMNSPEGGKSLLLGTHWQSKYPVFLLLELLRAGHMLIIGPTGTGKTSRGIFLILSQLMKIGLPVFFFDMKGSDETFQQLKWLSESERRRFRWLTNVVGRSTYVYNPFSSFRSGNLSLNQICEIILKAMRLLHGEGYGKSFFSRVSRLWLSDVMNSHPNISSFFELFHTLRTDPPKGNGQQDDKSLWRECFELISCVQSLSGVDALNWHNVPGASATTLAAQIRVEDVIRNREVVGCSFPHSREPVTSREIANLFIADIFETARLLKPLGIPCVVAVDEFQNIASQQAFAELLREAREFNIILILSHQSIADLKTEESSSLASVVLQNTGTKMIFGGGEPDIKEWLLGCAGHTTTLKTSVTTEGMAMVARYSTETHKGWRALWYGGPLVPSNLTYTNYIGSSRAKTPDEYNQANLEMGQSISVSQEVIPRLNEDDILKYSADPNACFVHFAQDGGLTQYNGLPFVIRTSYCISLLEKKYLDSLPWPAQTADTIVADTQSRLFRPFFKYNTPGQIAATAPSPTPATPTRKGKKNRAKQKAQAPPQAATNQAAPTPQPSHPTPTPTPTPGKWASRLQHLAARRKQNATPTPTPTPQAPAQAAQAGTATQIPLPLQNPPAPSASQSTNWTARLAKLAAKQKGNP